MVRFYLTNVANTRTFNVTFGGNPVKIVASDVGRYEREQWIPSVVIAPAERYVVDVRFDDPGEVAISNTIQAIDHFRGTFYPHVDTLSIVTVSDEAADPAISEAFEELRGGHRAISAVLRPRSRPRIGDDSPYSGLTQLDRYTDGIGYALLSAH